MNLNFLFLKNKVFIGEKGGGPAFRDRSEVKEAYLKNKE